MPNLNAALACAQLEKLEEFVANKRELAANYSLKLNKELSLIKEIEGAHANYWLNAIQLNNKKERDTFLEETNSNGVMTRPIWTLMNKLKMFENCPKSDLTNAKWLEERIVNIPSSVRI